MTCVLQDGPISWEMTRDDSGIREYLIVWGVVSSRLDGPQQVMNTPGLPLPGSYYLVDNDNDAWAFCTPYLAIKPKVTGEPNLYWEVSQKFSTFPLNRCQTTSFDNPLDEPDRVSGSFVNDKEEAAFDRFGNLITNSAFELFRGKNVEFDAHSATVRIEKSVSTLPLDTYTQMMNNVNDSPMWGVAARCVKLSNVTFERRWYGSCYAYYIITYEFEINFNTFDRNLRDYGEKAYCGRGSLSDLRSYTYIRDEDTGEITKGFLNGAGRRVSDISLSAVIHVERYPQSNLFLLGIPAIL